MQKLILPISDFKPTAGYKNAKYKKYWGYNHYGVDCVSASKTRALYGIGNGTVAAAGLDGLNGKTTGAGSGCGYCLVVIYKDCYNRQTKKATDVVCTYMHMSAMPKVKAGDKVTTKTLLGFYGNTGAATSGPHLHIQFDTDTKYPLCCTGLSSKGHNLFKKWKTDSTIDPVAVLNKGEGQALSITNSVWYSYYDFRALDEPVASEKVAEKKNDTSTIKVTFK